MINFVIYLFRCRYSKRRRTWRRVLHSQHVFPWTIAFATFHRPKMTPTTLSKLVILLKCKFFLYCINWYSNLNIKKIDFAQGYPPNVCKGLSIFHYHWMTCAKTTFRYYFVAAFSLREMRFYLIFTFHLINCYEHSKNNNFLRIYDFNAKAIQAVLRT